MAAKKKSVKKARGSALIGGKRQCGVCGKRGHNARSHQPGGRLAR